MSEIPEWGCNGASCQMYDDCRDGICDMAAIWDKAILAERERCAKIAEEWLEVFKMADPENQGSLGRDAVTDIIKAIRGTSQPVKS